MRDQAAAGLLDRLLDRLDVERDERAQVDDLGVEALFLDRGECDMDHRAVGEDGQRLAFADDRGLAQRHGVMAFGNFARRMLGPGLHRAVVVAVERAVVDALGLEEDHRVGVLDRGDQQALGIVRGRGDDDLQAGDMGEQAFRRLAVRLAAEDAAAIGRADDHRHRSIRRAVR